MEVRVNKKAGFGLAVILLATPMVAHYEGIVLKTYRDPVGIPTACMGETDNGVLSLKDRFTEQECTAVLGASMALHAQDVALCINKPLKAHEAAAVVSWSYNIGASAACGSTLVRKINAGAPAPEWCAELLRWVYARGRELPGLVARRQGEYSMCTAGRWQ